MSLQADFCESCGQKKMREGLNIIDLFKDFITNIFNLDGRLFRSIKHLWKPAFLAKEYIGGRRKSYVNPIRFFIVMLVSLFFLLNNSMNNEAFDEGTMNTITAVQQKKLVQVYDSTVCLITPDMSVDDEQELRNQIFGEVKERSPKIWISGNILGWKIKEYEVTRHDAYSMDIDSLFTKYELTEWYDQLFVKQLIKVDKDRSGSVSYFVSKLIWGVTICLFLIALVMKLLYIRQFYYYVEHLIVIILFSAKILILVNLILLVHIIDLNIPYLNTITSILYLFMIVYFFLTIKSYYKQGILKTFVKSTLILTLGINIFILSVLLVSLISLAFF